MLYPDRRMRVSAYGGNGDNAGHMYEDVRFSVLFAGFLQPHQRVVQTRTLLHRCIGAELEGD